MAKILFFGRLSDLSSARDLDLPSGVDSTDSLKAWLIEQDAGLADGLSGAGIFVSVNKEIKQSDAPITNDDEIAFMSALSGG